MTARALGTRTTFGEGADWLRLDHDIAFSLRVSLDEAAAREFVRDVELSLRHADFLTGLNVTPGEPPTVCAELPVNAALFGMRSLPFESEVLVTEDGARLVPRRLAKGGIGWAEVAGEARASAAAGSGPGSRLDYTFGITVYLAIPTAERWGMQALLKMVELTATNVLRKVADRFPPAIEASVALVADQSVDG